MFDIFLPYCFSSIIVNRLSKISFDTIDVYIYIYHINCGVIQRFPALRKVVTTHVKKYRIFSTRVVIANQLLTRNSPLAPLGQFDE